MLPVLLGIVCSVLILVGLAGIFLPLVPGVPLAWLGLFIYAIGTGFDRISITTTVILFGVMLLTSAIDIVAPMLGAKKYRASKWGIIGAFCGLLAGITIFGFWGVILGSLVGAIVGELLATRMWERALKSALGAFLGFIAGTLVKIVVVLTMLGFLISSWF